MEHEELHTTVREGYQILLRADAELDLPTEYERITQFYRALAEANLRWATEVRGELLRQAFSELQSTRERSRFGIQRYRFRVEPTFDAPELLSFLCTSRLTGADGSERIRRHAEVWLRAEECVLPPSEVLERFGAKHFFAKLPFRPNGICPAGNELIFFRDASPGSPACEAKFPIPQK